MRACAVWLRRQHTAEKTSTGAVRKDDEFMCSI